MLSPKQLTKRRVEYHGRKEAGLCTVSGCKRAQAIGVKGEPVLTCYEHSPIGYRNRADAAAAIEHSSRVDMERGAIGSMFDDGVPVLSVAEWQTRDAADRERMLAVRAAMLPAARDA